MISLIRNSLKDHEKLKEFNEVITMAFGLTQKKRFSPWLRKDKVTDLQSVKQYYGYSNEKASQALKILSPQQLEFIKQRLETGGSK